MTLASGASGNSSKSFPGILLKVSPWIVTFRCFENSPNCCFAVFPQLHLAIPLRITGNCSNFLARFAHGFFSRNFSGTSSKISSDNILCPRKSRMFSLQKDCGQQSTPHHTQHIYRFGNLLFQKFPHKFYRNFLSIPTGILLWILPPWYLKYLWQLFHAGNCFSGVASHFFRIFFNNYYRTSSENFSWCCNSFFENSSED